MLYVLPHWGSAYIMNFKPNANISHMVSSIVLVFGSVYLGNSDYYRRSALQCSIAVPFLYRAFRYLPARFRIITSSACFVSALVLRLWACCTGIAASRASGQSKENTCRRLLETIPISDSNTILYFMGRIGNHVVEFSYVVLWHGGTIALLDSRLPHWHLFRVVGQTALVLVVIEDTILFNFSEQGTCQGYFHDHWARVLLIHGVPRVAFCIVLSICIYVLIYRPYEFLVDCVIEKCPWLISNVVCPIYMVFYFINEYGCAQSNVPNFEFA